MTPGVTNQWPGLGPVATLLTAACSVDPEAAERGLERALSESIDEEELLFIANRNRVVPLVHRALHERGASGRFPRLRETAQKIRWRNMFLIEEMLHFVRRFEELGLDVMTFKGPILGLQLYDDHSDRMYKDLDVIVRPEDVPTALRLFRERGFEPEPKYGVLDSRGLDSHLKRDYEIRLYRSSVLIELHWDVILPHERGRIEVGDLWDRSVSIDLEGTSLRTLSPEDTFLHLVIHGSDKHGWMRLQMLADVARFLARVAELPMDAVLDRARRMGRERALLEGLGLTWLLLGARLPEAAAPRLDHPSALALAGVTMAHQFRHDRGLPRYLEWRSYIENLADQMTARGEPVSAMPGWTRYLLRALSITSSDRPVRLPPALRFAFFLYRPIRLLSKHGAGLFKRI